MCSVTFYLVVQIKTKGPGFYSMQEWQNTAADVYGAASHNSKLLDSKLPGFMLLVELCYLKCTV